MNSQRAKHRGRKWASDDPRRQKFAAKKDVILDAALPVFLRDGFSGASMEQVAVSANVSKMTVYRHFESKESLFLATINRHCDQIYDTEMYVPARDREEARAALGKFGRTFVETITAYDVMALWSMLVGEVSRFPDIGARFYDAGPARTIGVMTRIMSGIMPMEAANARSNALLHLLMGDAYQRILLRKATRDEAMPDFAPQIDLAIDMVLGA